MKKIIALICVLALCFSLTACGGKGGDGAENTTVVDAEAEAKQNKNLQIVATFIVDGDVNIVVKNNFKKTVKDFVVALVGYDSNGLSLSSEYETSSISAANILAGEEYCAEAYCYYASDWAYAEAMITSVTFDDGETWEARNIDKWAEKSIGKTFAKAEYDAQLKAMGTEAEKSANNGSLEITHSFAYDNYVYVVVKNISTKTILSFEAIYICYDSNGLPVSDGYESGSSSSANIIAGESKCFKFYENSCSHLDAIITSIEFDDGTTWENTDYKIWAITRGNYPVADYEAKVAAMAESAKKAETNQYLSFVSSQKVNDNAYSAKDDFDFTVKNIGTQTISKASYFILQYDANGYAISVDPYDSYCKNGRALSGSINLAAGTSGSFNSSLFFDGNCKQYKVIVSQVIFEDGTEWNNPNLYDWILYNSSTYIA